MNDKSGIIVLPMTSNRIEITEIKLYACMQKKSKRQVVKDLPLFSIFSDLLSSSTWISAEELSSKESRVSSSLAQS